MGLPITSDPVTCAFVELAGKSKQDTAPRKLVLSPAEMGEPPSAKDSGLKSGGRRNILMPCRSISMEASIRSISFSVTALLALLSSAALAQQSSGTCRFPVRRQFPNPHQRLRLHQPIPRLGQATRRPKATPGHMRPPVLRQPHTPQVHCRRRTVVQAGT
jgi:hypothetical protein